jgi:hypothetical protein
MINKRIEGNYEITETGRATIKKRISEDVEPTPAPPKVVQPTRKEIMDLLLEIKTMLEV